MLDIGIKIHVCIFFSEGHLLVSKNAGFLSCRMGMCPSSLSGQHLCPPPRPCPLPMSPQMHFKHWQGRSAGELCPCPP